jgi:hypothetical protein
MDKETGKAFEVESAFRTFSKTTKLISLPSIAFRSNSKVTSVVPFSSVEDLEDSEQTVEFNPDTPEISTTAKDSETGTNEGYADEKFFFCTNFFAVFR